MKRKPHARVVAIAIAAAIGLSACGGSSAPGSGTTGHKLTTLSGAKLFTAAGCAGCHTLAAAHATGSTGPDLDHLKPSFATVAHQVTNGGGGMPSFAGTLSKAQIAAVGHYVANVAGR